MDMKKKLAVLKLAGYEVEKASLGWDWNLFANDRHVSTAREFFNAKFEAANDAFDHLVSNTPKESNT